MSGLKNLQSWINAFRKANDCDPTIKAVQFKIKELLKEPESKSKSKQVYFRDSQWSDYNTLRADLASDKKFVRDYAGVDLKAYIEQALAWSETKNQTSTDMGWRLTLKNWMRRAKDEGKLIMKPVVNNQPKGHINY